MNDDDLMSGLHDLGGPVSAMPAPPEQLRRVRRGIVRRHRLRAAGVGGAVLLSVAAVGTAVAVTAGGGRNATDRILPAQSPTPAVATPAPPKVAVTPSADPVTSAASTSPSGTGSTTPGTSSGTDDVFAETTSDNRLITVSAVTGAVLRTLAPSSADARSPVVGPSGRFVYYIDANGPERIPIGGGTPQLMPVPRATSPGGAAVFIDADRSDTKLVETIGSADDSRPVYAAALDVNGTGVSDLGQGTATGWAPDGLHAYITTVSSASGSTAQVGSFTDIVTVTSVLVSDPAQRQTIGSLTSASPSNDSACGSVSIATAVSPAGEVGWALAGCSIRPNGQLSYAFRDVEAGTSLSGITLPRDDWSYYAQTLVYTPAGTAVLLLTREGCIGQDPVVTVRGNGATVTDLPRTAGQCR